MIRFVPEVGSTSRALADRIAAGDYVPEGEWLVADRQSRGQGRLGRVWEDGAGNFMGSTVVHTRFGDPAAPTLALVAGLAVQSVVSELLPPHGRAAQLKWPNDLMIGTAKLAGILLESAAEAVIVGMGVNLASAPAIAGRETIALARLGSAPDRNMFADRLAHQFNLELQRWRDFGLAPIIRRWLAAAFQAGTALSVASADGALDGSFAGLDDGGALLLRLADGAIRVVHAGEVRLAASAEG